MDLSGIPLELSKHEFPMRDAISRDSISEEMHFVMPKKHMKRRVRTVADFGHNHLDYVYISALTFLAEAFSNVVRHRGDLRPDNMMNDLAGNFASRITPVLSYIPSRTHHEDGSPLDAEELLDDDNIVAYMFSFFVRDPQLHISYAIADQIEINRYGLPQFRKKGEDDEGVMVAPGAAPANAPLGQNVDADNLAGPNAFDSDEDSDDSHEMDEFDNNNNNNNPPPAALPNQNNVDADKYRSLDGYGSRYWYPKKIGAEKKFADPVKRPRGPHRATAHRSVSSNMDYANFFGCFINGLDIDNGSIMRLAGDSSNFSVASIPGDDPLHPNVAFSLDVAVQKLERLGAAPIFCLRRNWSDMDNNFVVPEQLELHVAAQLRLSRFNAQDLFDYRLPHCQILDRNFIRPPSEKGLGSEVLLDSGAHKSVENYLNSTGVFLEHERVAQLQAKHVVNDCWQEYFDKFHDVESTFRRRFKENKGVIDDVFKRELKQFRMQGLRHYSALNCLNNPTLPDGNKALIEHVIKLGEVRVPILHLFEPLSDTTQSAYSQWRANEMLFAESIFGICDFMVPLFPKVMTSTAMVWLPRMGGSTNKEHQQFIGPPGTMKSDTLGRIQDALIDNTYRLKSGGSKKGILGPHRSQRQIEIYHELNNILSPSKDPMGSEQDTTEMKLMQLSEGKYIYDSTMEDPKTNERIDVRKVSDYTNIIIGAKNPPGRRTLSRDGSGSAMLDRFTRNRIIPTAAPGRMSISERVFQDFMSAGSCSEMPREMFNVIQLAVADYCCMMGCYARPLPNIELFSDVAPNGIAFLATMHPELANRLREIAHIKTRLYSETLMNSAKYAVCSAIGLAGQALVTGEPYIYNAEEATAEMSRYCYTDMETLVYVMSSSVYNMSEGQYNAIAATFILETTSYEPLGHGKEIDNPQDWPVAIDLDAPVQSNAEAVKRATEAQNINNWSLEQVLNEVLDKGIDYLGKPRLNSKTGQVDEQQYVMRPHTRAANPNSNKDDEGNVDLDLFSIVAGATNRFEDPPRLKRDYVSDFVFKVENYKNQQYINFNYVRIDGTPDDFANSFSHTVGDRVMTPDSIKDVIYALKRTRIIAPYIPVMPKTNKLCLNHPGYIQSLRHSAKALKEFKLYNLPVLIEDSKRFYLLVSFAETNPAVVISKMVESMCYEATRETHTMVGVPDRESAFNFQTVHIKPRPGVVLTVARKSNLTKQNFERLRKQFGIEENSIDGFNADGMPTVYKSEDIEEHHALNAIKYADSDLTLDQARRYTPRGIWERFYGVDGVYKPGNPYTVNAEPIRANNGKRKVDDQAPISTKRQHVRGPVSFAAKPPVLVPVDMTMRGPRFGGGEIFED